jgi:multiple sugar transport system substrate-binding protein
MQRQMTRRSVLRWFGVGCAGGLLAACQPKVVEVTTVVEKVVEKAVKETVIVEGTPQVVEKVVKETVFVEVTPAPKEPVTITWLMRSSPSETPWEEERLNTWNSLRPETQVNLVSVPYAEVDPKLSTMVAAGTPPDVFSQWGEQGFGEYYARKLPLELTPFIDRDGYDMGQFITGAVEPYIREGTFFSVPQVHNFAILMFYNKKMFDEAGIEYPPMDWNDKSWNVDRLTETAKKLTKNYGQGMDAQYGTTTLGPLHFLAYLWGGDCFTKEHYETGMSQTSQLDSRPVIDAAQAQADLIYKHQVTPTPAETKTIGQLGNIFMTGRVAMTKGLASDMRLFMQAEFKYGLAPLPWKVDNKRYAFTGCWMAAAASPNPDQAWQFMKYLVDEESCRGLANAGFGVPRENVMKEVWLPKYQEKSGMSIDDLSKIIFGSMDNSEEHVNHLFVGWSKIIQMINMDLDPLWLGNAAAEEVLPPLKQKLDRVLKGIWDEFH